MSDQNERGVFNMPFSKYDIINFVIAGRNYLNIAMQNNFYNVITKMATMNDPLARDLAEKQRCVFL